MFGWHVQVPSGANIEDLPCSSVEPELLPPTLTFAVQDLEGLVAVPLRRVGDWLPKVQLEEETRDILHRKISSAVKSGFVIPVMFGHALDF